MSQMNGSLIANAGAFGSGDNSYIANIIDGGQNGFGPILPNLDANTPAVYLPLQIIVTHVPTIFKYIPGGVSIFKSLFETSMVSLEGLDFQYTMEVEGTPVGRDGQMQNVPTKQVRSQISPVGLWPEKIGNLVFNMFRIWMNAMRDPDTQASSMAGIIPAGTTLPPLVASMFSADIMCIQYDTTMRPENIIDAFALTNFFPTDIGSPGYQYNTTEVHRPDRSITFTCITQHNRNVTAAAKNIASLLNLHQINFQDALPVAQSIEAEISGEGLERQVAEILETFRPLDGSN
jgi:hypothetical protein